MEIRNGGGLISFKKNLTFTASIGGMFIQVLLIVVFLHLTLQGRVNTIILFYKKLIPSGSGIRIHNFSFI